MRERPDEIAEDGGGQRAIDPAVSLSQVGVVVIRAQHDLERPGAAHEAGDVLRAARAGDNAKRQLELTEDRRLSRSKAHVARQHELAADASTMFFTGCAVAAAAAVMPAESATAVTIMQSFVVVLIMRAFHCRSPSRPWI